MASTLLARSTVLASSRTTQRIATQALIRPATALIPNRQSSTEKNPTAAATALINSFPGSNPAQKAGSVLLFSSIAAWLISKEIYIIDAEFFEMGCIFGAYYIWYSSGKEGAVEYLNERKNTMRRVLNDARAQHKEVVQERINHIGKLADVVDVTKGMFEANNVKTVLDSWVRHEASIREREQKRLSESVIAKIREELANPAVQQQILNKTLADVEKITKTAA
ncbi:atp4 subunit B of the stator stalk of mitochondrial F1F0 ATP synthase [Blyttiomyces sp. JEL0837]|nr:atp4 subunit B of the stator stalk of mitochondrial F1F0 ATP synthase [Blyttiomyces sp. JEL0837]